MKRAEKKSESLEIRLPYSQKQAFMEACRDRGVTASDVLRGFITDDLENDEAGSNPPQGNWTMTVKNNPFKTAAGIAGTALAAATLGTGVSLADDQVFEAYDRNNDGVINYSEFVGDSGSERSTVYENGEVVTDTIFGPDTRNSGHRDLFESLDANNSRDLDRTEFEGRGTFTRKSDQIIERDGQEKRVIGLEIFDYDIEDEENTSISITSSTRSIEVDATPAEVKSAFNELETQMKGSRHPAPPAPPTPRD